jgi:hypothetical protein
MPSSYEVYNTNDDWRWVLYGSAWKAQTFTVGASGHTVTSVKLKFWRIGNPGTVTVSIRATDVDGHPTGSDLTSGTIDGNTFTTDSNGAFYEISLAEYTLTAGTKYAIVVRATGGGISDQVWWRLDASSPTYTGGNSEYSADSGGSWTSILTWDCMFEVWGNPPSINLPSHLLHAGYWPRTYWPSCYWDPDYWPEYGTGAPPSIVPLPLEPGYWQPTYWCHNYWHPTYWQRYGVTIPPIIVDSGSPRPRKPLDLSIPEYGLLTLLLRKLRLRRKATVSVKSVTRDSGIKQSIIVALLEEGMSEGEAEEQYRLQAVGEYMFVAVGDDVTCEECMDHDGETYTLDEVDSLFPYAEEVDESLIMPMVHINCRCTLNKQ